MSVLGIVGRIAVFIAVCLVLMAFVGPWWGIGLTALLAGGYGRQLRHRPRSS